MPTLNKNALVATGGLAGLSVAGWRMFCPWIQYDIQSMKCGMKIMKSGLEDVKNSRFFVDKFEDSVRRFPNKPYIICDNRCYTFEYVNTQANKAAYIISRWRLEKGDSIALFIHNSPEYIWIFLGLQKLGIIATLLNTNTKGEALQNAIEVTDTKAIIVGSGEDLLDAVNSIDEIKVPVFLMGQPSAALISRYQSWDSLMLMSLPVEISPSTRRHLDMSTTLCYVFTSGTTGLPKAAIVDHRRMTLSSKLMLTFDAGPHDVLYDVLPFYHFAGMIGWISAGETGCTVVIRKKFSAQNFLSDCRAFNVTIVQYIGELCRFLLAQPEDPRDSNHCIKGMIGIGLRKDVWIQLKNRFRIPKIIECFGASEGVAAFSNVCGKPGAIGRLSPLLNKLDPTPKYLVKYDITTANPVRDKSGSCSTVNIGEPGLLICQLPEFHSGDLYKGRRELSEKKILRNVFEKGDAYFNFGDSMILDKDYFLYFHDRVGDTFRWKGENVATTEVSNVLMKLPFVLDANVYGVAVPGHDGKAGMVALTLKNGQQLTKENLKTLYLHCESMLPKYVRPIFLRLEQEPRMTVTFKQHKVDLMNEGFDLNLICDPLFYLSEESKTYLPLTTECLPSLLQSKL